MATNEAGFKLEFRRALAEKISGNPGSRCHIWTHTDAFKHGLPDFQCAVFWHHGGKGTYPMEAKFVTKVPARESSAVLKHPLSSSQYSHLVRSFRAGLFSTVVIGMPDIAICIPIHMWPREGSANITLKELRAIPEKFRVLKRARGGWEIGTILETLAHECELGRAALEARLIAARAAPIEIKHTFDNGDLRCV